MLGGPGALLSALGQARTGHMGDIVGTIQREQDEIIRSPLPGVLVVQGGPGTGKTAVALHRAAYLLYTHRFPLERQGVLVVGPEPAVPALHRAGPALAGGDRRHPLHRVGPGARGPGPRRGRPAVARLKGDVRMARVLARAVRTRQRPLRHDVEVPFGAGVLRLRARTDRGDRRRGPPPPGHPQRAPPLRRGPGAPAPWPTTTAPGSPASDGRAERRPTETTRPSAEEQADLAQRLRRAPEVAEALDRMWPRLSPHELLHDLFGARPLLAAAGQGILSAEEVARLYRPRSAALDEVPWTAADAALIDEARTLARAPRRCGPPEPGPPGAGARKANAQEAGSGPRGWTPRPLPTTGPRRPDRRRHPLLRAHRGRRGAGSLAPAAAHAGPAVALGLHDRGGRHRPGHRSLGPESWDDVTRHLSPATPPRLVELTVSYRTPAEVVDVAAQVLAVAAPGITPPRPVRQSGFTPRIVAASRAGLAGRGGRGRPGRGGRGAPGRVAVLGPAVLLPELAAALADAGLDPVDPRDPAGRGAGRRSGRCSRPTRPTASSSTPWWWSSRPWSPRSAMTRLARARRWPPHAGLRTLYVALTRPTRRLAVVHAEPLPVDPGRAPTG